MKDLINLDDFEAAAQTRLPVGAREYYRGGANDEITLRENRLAWGRLRLHYRVLRDVATRDLSTNVLGKRLSWPVMLAPTAYHRMAHPDGEIASSRAAAALDTQMVLSTLSNTAMEDVAREARSGWWFQLYVYRDRLITRDLIARAEASGCGAIAVTVDAPVGGQRERDVRNQFSYPADLPMQNLVAAGSHYSTPDLSQGGFMGYVNAMFDPSLSWTDLDWLCAQTKLPILLKGVARADDAQRAVSHGARGIIVSNHGGRQLDTSPATADVLQSIAAAVGDKIDVLVDGGIRRGTDVVKALALGARAVLLGRPIIWGLAVGGEAGVRRVLEIIQHEFSVAMALCGCANVREIDASLLGDRANPVVSRAGPQPL